MCLRSECNYESVATAATTLRGVNFDTRMNIPALLTEYYFPVFTAAVRIVRNRDCS